MCIRAIETDADIGGEVGTSLPHSTSYAARLLGRDVVDVTSTI